MINAMNFGQVAVSRIGVRVRAIFNRVPMRDWTQYIGRQNKEATWCDASSNAMSTAYWMFEGGLEIIVFWDLALCRDAMSTLSLLRGVAIPKAGIPAARMLVALTLATLLWSTSSGGQSKYAKGPACPPCLFRLLAGAGRWLSISAVRAMICLLS